MHDDRAHGTWRREARTVQVARPRTPRTVSAPFAITAARVRSPRPLEFSPHDHALHELVWVRDGTMTARIGASMLTIPEGFGLWLPAGTEHSGRTTAGAELCDAHFEPSRSPLALSAPAVVEVSPVLGALLTHLELADLDAAARLRAESVVFDLIRPHPRPFALTVPERGRIAIMVDALLADPTDNRSASDWADLLGISERSITRSFRSQTGLSYLQWRQALRVHRALALLGEGALVQEVADSLGYAQASTFIAVFKRATGTTPRAFMAGNAATV